MAFSGGGGEILREAAAMLEADVLSVRNKLVSEIRAERQLAADLIKAADKAEGE